jgi:nucleoside-diphosphate-sugar epimerase
MSAPLILVTGSTGHLGFRVLLDALKAGYRVRAAVRSDAKAQTILTNPVLKAAKIPSEQLTFVIVPDLAVAHAYDEAVKGVDYIIHIASPITNGQDKTQEEYQKFFIEPAHKGTVGMLESAATEPKVKRIVITSSVVAQLDFLKLAGVTPTEEVFNAESRVAFHPGPYPNEFGAYSASKVKSLNEAEAWVKAKSPGFDVVFIHPAFIQGRDDLVLDLDHVFGGTNGVILRVATGVKSENALPGATVHNEDVARLHVEALQKDKIPAGSYVASWNPAGAVNGTNWSDASQIVAKHFPDAVKSGKLSAEGVQPSILEHFDSTKTEKTFGWKLQSYEEQVKSVAGHYLELATKA